MTFEEWLQQQLASGKLTRDSSNRIWNAHPAAPIGNMPLSTQQLNSYYSAQQAMPGAQGAGAAAQPQDQFRDDQAALIAQLQGQAAGTGPSLVQGQLQKATDANMQQAMGFGAAQQAQGVGGAAALRNISDARAGIQQNSAAESAMLKNAEQMQARDMLAQLLNGARGQDIQTQLGQGQLDLQNRAQDWTQQQAQQQMMMRLLGGFGQGFASMATMGAGGGGQSQQQYGTPFQNYGGSNPNEWNNPYGGYAHGGPVDSPAHDTVPAMLSPGEIVLPVSVAQSGDAPARAAAFVAAIKRKKAA